MKEKTIHQYFQLVIRNTPDFLENPQYYVEQVFTLLCLFYDKDDKFFEKFTILFRKDKGYEIVALVELENETSVFQINCIDYRDNPTFKLQVQTDQGIEFLKVAIKDILNIHINRSFDEIFDDLSEDAMNDLEESFQTISKIPERLSDERITMSAKILFQFFNGRDTVLKYDGFVAKADFREHVYNLDIFRGEKIEIGFHYDKSAKNLSYCEYEENRTEGVFKLQELVALRMYK